MNIHAITETCKRINWTRGRGELVGDVQMSTNGNAVAVRQPFGMPCETRKVTILDNGARVRFLGVVRKVQAA